MKTTSAHGSEPLTANSQSDLLMNSLTVSVSKHLLDSHYTLVWADNRYYEMFGYTQKEYEAFCHNQCDLYNREDPDDWKALVAAVDQALAKGEGGFTRVCRVRHRNGQRLWIQLVGSFTDEQINGYPVCLWVLLDLSQQMQAQMEQTVAYNHLPGCVAKYRVTPEGFAFWEANEEFARLFEQVIFLPKEAGTDAAIPTGYHTLMHGGAPVSFVLGHKQDSRTMWLRVSGECIDWIDQDPLYLLMYVDITDLTEQQKLQQQTKQKLERLAFVDSITGGPNRTCFEMEAGQAILAAPPGRYVLVWLNLQKFKLINDLAGTEAGNQTLRYIYYVIQSHLETGEYAARLSADDYALLLNFKTRQQVEKRLLKMAEDINSFNQERSKKYILSFTAGAYCVDDPALPITQIQDRAHVARKSIRNVSKTSLCTCLFYNDLDRQQLMREQNIENRMRDALARQEFELYLQPKLSLKTNAIAGAEALIRWNDPEKGLILPNDFIPYFEKNGFVVELDLYVFDKVCALLHKWIEHGLQPVPVSVNMSRVHLLHSSFLDRYTAVLQRYQVPPGLLEIELTETMAANNPAMLANVIREIHRQGFQCSIDDFGSGYSSLNVLKDMEVDTLKLDRSFCTSGQSDASRECIVIASVLDLAAKLGMATVAEGVETGAQVQFLRQANCDVIQGYVFAYPQPVADFEKLLFGREVQAV